jgi:hypothetical protein
MNPQGVALAADSAVTVESPRGQKIFNTINKLFTLSKYAPVGVMVYGNAHISGVPWETIVKEYRAHLGTSRFPTLQEYADGLIKFIESNGSLFPEDQELQEVQTHALGFFTQIRSQVLRDLDEAIASKGSVTDAQVRSAVRKRIRASYNGVASAPDLPDYPTDYCTKLHLRFDKALDDIIEYLFQKLPISAPDRQRLKDTLCNFMIKDVFPSVSSGVVVAGYGDDEHFPRLYTYDTQSVLLGRLKHKLKDTSVISADTSAIIQPFAQREMVQLFMEGIDPLFRNGIERAIRNILEGLPAALLSEPSLRAASSRVVERRLKGVTEDIFKKFQAYLEGYSQTSHVDPITSAVALLPKDQLAEMAEALVNLTSFKRRVTMEPETVGGPIDVAVISKGDGFIWIRRKHYFRPELNHHFFTNYFQTR